MTRRAAQRSGSGIAPPGLAGPRRARYVILLGALLVALIVASHANSWWFYRSVRSEMDRQLGQRLLSIATTVARTIGTERFGDIAVLGPASAQYEVVRSELESIARLNDLDNVTLVDAEARTVLDLRGPGEFGRPHPVLALQPELETVLISGVPQATSLVPVRVEGLADQFLKTGFAPLEDESGAILGAVVVEGGSGFFSVLPQMRRQLLWTSAWGLAAVLVVGFFFFRILRSLIRLEDSMRRTAALAAIGQISAVVAHEIKNPLAIIHSRAERVRSKIASGKDPREVLEWFEAIPAEVDRLNEIVTNYLSLARPEGSGEGRCRVAQVVQETVRLLEHDLTEKGIVIRLDLADPENLIAPMGPRSLKQLLLNLILNAAQAIERDGTISIESRRASPWVELVVADDGAGLVESERSRVLEPFYTTKPTGSGLGLTLVSSLVQARGGRLEIESSRGRGTRVRTLLPEERRPG
jgi:two-component system sensor histidine kinase HydH